MVGRVIRWALVAASMVLLALAAAPFVDTIRYPVVPVIQALGRMVVLAAIMMVVVALVARTRTAAVISLTAALTALVTLIGFNGPGCVASSREIRLLALNAFESRVDTTRIADVIRDNGVNVLIMVEIDASMVNSLLQELGEHELVATTSGPYAGYQSGGSVIMSAFPMDELHEPDDAVGNEQPIARLHVDGRSVLVRAIHPHSPVPHQLAEWHAGLRHLGEWQQSQRGIPLIMAGDFNASRGHPVYREATQGLDNAAGWWSEATWPNDRWFPPFVDIDHVMIRGLKAEHTWAISFDGSDHRALYSELRVCR